MVSCNSILVQVQQTMAQKGELHIHVCYTGMLYYRTPKVASSPGSLSFFNATHRNIIEKLREPRDKATPKVTSSHCVHVPPLQHACIHTFTCYQHRREWMLSPIYMYVRLSLNYHVQLFIHACMWPWAYPVTGLLYPVPEQCIQVCICIILHVYW